MDQEILWPLRVLNFALLAIGCAFLRYTVKGFILDMGFARLEENRKRWEYDRKLLTDEIEHQRHELTETQKELHKAWAGLRKP